MSALRGVLGAAIGAGVAATVVRLRARARAEELAPGELLERVPELLADDARRIAAAARVAVQDGRAASTRARSEFAEQVAAHGRRMEQHDV